MRHRGLFFDDTLLSSVLPRQQKLGLSLNPAAVKSRAADVKERKIHADTRYVLADYAY